jgi:hypothetical protein
MARKKQAYIGQHIGAPMAEEPGAIFTCKQRSRWVTSWSISCMTSPFPMMSDSPRFSLAQTPSGGEHFGTVETCERRWVGRCGNVPVLDAMVFRSQIIEHSKIFGSLSKWCIQLRWYRQRCYYPRKFFESTSRSSWAQAGMVQLGASWVP